MNTTIYEATAILPDQGHHRPVILMMGHNRQHYVGAIAYKICRPMFADFSPQTLPQFARLQPVMLVDGDWRSVMTEQPIIKQWSDPATLIERI